MTFLNAPKTTRWVDVRAVAEHFSLSASFIYEHAAELGGIKTGSSPSRPSRKRLRGSGRRSGARAEAIACRPLLR
jgi:hypothetical protein